MVEPIISKHGKKRLKERLGLGRKAQYRHLRYVIQRGHQIYKDMDSNQIHIEYDYRRYIFAIKNNLRVLLITVFPRNFKMAIV